MKVLQSAGRLWLRGSHIGSFPAMSSPGCSRLQPLRIGLPQLSPTTITNHLNIYTSSTTHQEHTSSADSPKRATQGRFNVGAFGAGRIGRMHLRNVMSHPRLRLQWIVDDDEKARKTARDELHLHETPFMDTSSISHLLEEDGLDGVFVLTPTESHADLILRSLDKGIAVFTEKPTAETREEIEQCYTLAETKGAPLFTGFMRRLDPVMCDLYSAVREKGVVGKVFNIKTISRDSPQPSYEFLLNTDPNGCNLLSDMAVHDVDMLVWLTDEEVPESIYVVTHAHDAVLSAKGVDDSMTVVIKYPSGIIATIDSCRGTTYGYDIRMEVFGSKGMMMVENPRETTSVIDGAGGGVLRRLFHSYPQRFEKAFQLEIDHFVRCMEGTATPPVTKTQALMTARIIEKGVQSSLEKRPVYF